METSFFEHLGIADVERIHSQMIAWIFDPACKAFDEQQKNELLRDLFDLDSVSKIKITTEHNSVDILVETDKDIIAIENKLKSSQHDDQLPKYLEYIRKAYPEKKPHCYFLTLIGEKANKDGWIESSYDKIFRLLNQMDRNQNENHSVIICEYLIYLKKLTTVANHFKRNYQSYDSVFKDGSKKKIDKINLPLESNDELEAGKHFISKNQLETILQKLFLSLLSEIFEFEDITSEISETRGSALIDFILDDEIEYKKNKYRTCIQFQHGTVKFTFAIKDGYSKSSKDWVKDIIPIMEGLKIEYKYKKLNKPTKLAYISISNKIHQDDYWKLSLEDLSKLIKKEYDTGLNLSKKLNKKILEL